MISTKIAFVPSISPILGWATVIILCNIIVHVRILDKVPHPVSNVQDIMMEDPNFCSGEDLTLSQQFKITVPRFEEYPHSVLFAQMTILQLINVVYLHANSRENIHQIASSIALGIQCHLALEFSEIYYHTAKQIDNFLSEWKGAIYILPDETEGEIQSDRIPILNYIWTVAHNKCTRLDEHGYGNRTYIITQGRCIAEKQYVTDFGCLLFVQIVGCIIHTFTLFYCIAYADTYNVACAEKKRHADAWNFVDDALSSIHQWSRETLAAIHLGIVWPSTMILDASICAIVHSLFRDDWTEAD
jgi:hypothetical protein